MNMYMYITVRVLITQTSVVEKKELAFLHKPSYHASCSVMISKTARVQANTSKQGLVYPTPTAPEVLSDKRRPKPNHKYI